MNENTKQLRQIMHDYKLKSHDIAELLNKKAQTVRLYMCERIVIKEEQLLLISFKLKKAKRVPTAKLKG